MRRIALASSLALALTLSTASVASAQPVIPSVPSFFIAVLSGAEEVPPRATNARGVAIFRQDGGEVCYQLIVANIRNVVAAHIHTGARGVNGPVVQFLYGNVAPGGGPINGVIASDCFTPSATLLQQMRDGGTYVNVHTNDGVDPPNTGPGDFPGGEIRGQIRALGPSF